jgi:hypothetical protein
MAAASQLTGLTRATVAAGAGFGFVAGFGVGVGVELEVGMEKGDGDENGLMTGALDVWQVLAMPTAGLLPKKLLVQLTVPITVRSTHFLPAPNRTFVSVWTLNV